MNTKTAAVVSNAGLLTAVVLVVLWPVTGDKGFGVAALGALLLAVAFAGMNIATRPRAPRLVRPAESCGGSCAACTLSCAPSEAAK